MPVVSLLPAGNVKVKFFVPESRLSAITIGQAVQLSCDGCAPLSAQVSFISPQAEYTSPLIYSKENRASLVYLVEARAKSGEMLALHPGQPVEVRF
jgi:HlyD family secretion protein